MQMYLIRVLCDKGVLLRKRRPSKMAKLECVCTRLNKERQLGKSKLWGEAKGRYELF